MMIMKFGGTSLGSAERIRIAGRIIQSKLERAPIIVVSALSGVTNLLLELAEEKKEKVKTNIDGIYERHNEVLLNLGLSKNLLDEEFKEIREVFSSFTGSKEIQKFKDLISSFGEKMSSKILAEHLNKRGILSKAYNAYDLGILTDDVFGSAELLPGYEALIQKKFEEIGEKIIPVVTGFIGKNKSGEITVLGRGGSDYTAAIIGASVGAEEIQIWTDVNGIMTADPKIVSNARTIPFISFEEAAELATFGTKVVHPKTIQPAVRKNIPVKILNSFDQKNSGTVIGLKSKEGSYPIAISSKKNLSLLKVKSTRMLHAPGFLARLFRVFEENNLSVDLIATSEISISLTFDNDFDESKRNLIKKSISNFGKIEFIRNKSIISVVGKGLKNEKGLVSRIVSVFSEKGINIDFISYGASEINISFVVDEEFVDLVVKELHRKLIEKENKQ